MKYLVKYCLVACALFLAHAATGQSFKANIDRNIVEFGDTVNVSFVYTGNADKQTPNLNALTKDFDVLSYYPSLKQISNNGNVTVINSWELVLEPKSKGKIIIPSVSFKGLKTDPIELTVNEPGNTPAAGKDIFLETIVDKSTAYVQEQITVTFKLYYTVQIEAEPEALEINDVVIKTLDNKQYQRRINGKLYRVVEVPYALFAQRSGTVVIPQTTWQIRVATAGTRQSSLFGNFGRYELRKFRSDEKVIRIKPIPDAFPANAPWLPAKSIEASESWSQKNLSLLEVGEPVTRTIQIQGQGIESAQIPSFLSSSSDGILKTYKEPPQLEDETNQFGILGKRTESAAMVLSESGETKTKEIVIPWWNTETDQLEQVVIPAVNLATKAGSAPSLAQPDVSNQAPIANSADSASDSLNPASFTPSEAKLFNWLTYVLIATNLMLILAVTLLALRRPEQSKTIEPNTLKPQKDSNLKTLLNTLDSQISARDLEGAYETLQRISRLSFGLIGLNDLKSLAHEHKFDELSEDISQIEASLFGGKDDKPSKNFSNLSEQLQRLSTQSTENQTEMLKPLYG